MTTYKLNQRATDNYTGVEGTLTLWELREDGRFHYYVQPHGLHPETGAPVDGFWTITDAILNGETMESDVPKEVLGTSVTDEVTGFTGTAIYLTQHISGCLHVGIQPKGKNKNGSVFESRNFDLRRCIGVAIPKLTDAERAESQEKKPSPSGGSYHGTGPNYRAD